MSDISDDTGPITLEFINQVKQSCMSFSYGYQFEGFLDPSISELKLLKVLLKAAIREKKGEARNE